MYTNDSMLCIVVVMIKKWRKCIKLAEVIALEKYKCSRAGWISNRLHNKSMWCCCNTLYALPCPVYASVQTSANRILNYAMLVQRYSSW